MNVDEQLRAALSQEADMQNVPAPDVDRLISGGRARQHRRTRTRFGAAAAVLVLLAGGAYGVTKIASGDTAVEPAVTPHSTPQIYRNVGQAPLEPGTYRMPVGVDASGGAIDADLTVHGSGWFGNNFPVSSDESGRYGGVAVYRPLSLAAGTGCLKEQPNEGVAQTAGSLAHQLAHLPRSTVLQQPAAEEAFGRQAYHVQLQIDQNCGKGVYRVAQTINGGHGITYGDSRRAVVVDFWVEEVGRVPVVVESWHQQGASTRMLGEIDRTRESIRFVTLG
jgi:hypothetical protein